MSDPQRYHSLYFNCGFARCASKELSGHDQEKRKTEFKLIFSHCPDYGLNETYFLSNEGRCSPYERHHKIITAGWNKKWNPASSRTQYESTFSLSAWKALSKKDQQRHTLSCCNECSIKFKALQQSFPIKPYHEISLISINETVLKRLGKKEGTQGALKKLNETFADNFDRSFTQSLLKHGKESLQVKPTKNEEKQKLRKIYRNCRDKENESLKVIVPKAMLQEDESIKSYQRKRMLEHFDTPPAKIQCTEKSKSHSPNFENVTWDKEAVIRDLEQHPTAPPAINWRKFAREHGIPGANCGQVAKDFAKTCNINTLRLDGRESGKRKRMRKRRLYGGEISAPTYPTKHSIKDSWQTMVETGELSLGIPCAPYTFIVTNGELEKKQTVVTGRKFPLQELREKLLAKQEKYMRLSTNSEIEAMSSESLKQKLSHIQEECSEEEDMRERLKEVQRTR